MADQPIAVFSHPFPRPVVWWVLVWGLLWVQLLLGLAVLVAGDLVRPDVVGRYAMVLHRHIASVG